MPGIGVGSKQKNNDDSHFRWLIVLCTFSFSGRVYPLVTQILLKVHSGKKFKLNWQEWLCLDTTDERMGPA